jgi:hypothetical protein
MENEKSKDTVVEDSIEKISKHDISKVGGLEYLTEKTLEWEHILLKAIQIAPIDAGLILI